MKKRNVILAANITLALGAAGLFTYGKWEEHKAHQTHEREVSQLVEHFKSCPDSFRTTRECFSEEERNARVSQANALRDSGSYLEAGRIFVELGPNFLNDAQEMAGRCDNNGRLEITRKIQLRREAATRSGLLQ